MDGLPGQGRHRLSVRFMDLTSNKKSPAPLREQGQKIHFLRYHLACRFRGRSVRRQHAVCPLTLALRRKILRPKARSPRPLRPICCIALSLRSQHPELSVDACVALLPLRRFKICYAYLTPNVCVCQELFFTGGGQAPAILCIDRASARRFPPVLP